MLQLQLGTYVCGLLHSYKFVMLSCMTCSCFLSLQLLALVGKCNVRVAFEHSGNPHEGFDYLAGIVVMH